MRMEVSISPVTKGTIIDSRDSGLHGNYGSDIIFTENGVQLRGGMLLSKDGKNPQQTQSLLDYPQMAKKMGRLNLKKFPTAYQSTQETVTSTQLAIGKLKYVVEYEIDSLTNPTQLKLFVYQIVGGYGVQFNTNVFLESSVFSTTDTTAVKLINLTGNPTDPTYIKILDGTINSAYIELRELLHLIDINGLTELESQYSSGDIHPFFYRPTPNFRLTAGSNSTEISNKALFLSKIQVRNEIGGSGLVFSITRQILQLFPLHQQQQWQEKLQTTANNHFLV